MHVGSIATPFNYVAGLDIHESCERGVERRTLHITRTPGQKPPSNEIISHGQTEFIALHQATHTLRVLSSNPVLSRVRGHRGEGEDGRGTNLNQI